MSPQNPDTPAVPVIEDKALDKESVIELLGEDDDKEQETLELEEPPKKGQKDKSEKSEETDEETSEEENEEEPSLEDELEEELQEPSDEELELVEVPSRREILAKYPNLYKDFPHLERAFYREQKYSELLPTIKDAEAVVKKAGLLDQYEKEITNGSTESFLSTIRDKDKKVFAKVVDNYLNTLYKVDQNSYFHTVGNVIKDTIISMIRDGKAQESEELTQAASILNQYIFGTTEITRPQKLSQDDVVDDATKKKEEELSRKEKELIEKQYTTARDEIGYRIDNVLKATVNKMIDPNGSMTEYVKDIAVNRVLSNLASLISRDIRFRGIYDKLWEKAFDSNFSIESKDSIRKAYLSKAKTLLQILIKKERNEALKGSRKVSNNDNDQKDKRGPLPVGKTRSSATLTSGKSNNSGKTQIPRGMTTLEYLNSDD